MQQNNNQEASPTKQTKATFLYRPYGKKDGFKIDPKVWNILTVFINGLLAGFIFSLGAVAYLSVDSRYLGSALFTVGIMLVFSYGFGFYTSKIGYCLGQNMEQNLMLIPVWFGNLIGAMLAGWIFSLTREDISEKLFERANELCGDKLADTAGGILILSIICGLLMFVATDSYKNAKNAAQRYLTLFLTVMVFVLCELEHFTANAFYFVVADALNIKAIWYLLIMTLGNSLGALIIPACHMGIRYLRGLGK